MKRVFLIVAAGLAMATAPAPLPVAGKWKNPAKSVIIAVQPCGAQVCGTIVWANDDAKAKAAKGGNPNLVGMQLLQRFDSTGPNKWKGKVYVPDINKTVDGTIALTSKTTLEVKGCLLGSIACKEQVWMRVK